MKEYKAEDISFVWNGIDDYDYDYDDYGAPIPKAAKPKAVPEVCHCGITVATGKCTYHPPGGW